MLSIWAWGPVYKGLHRADSGTRLEMRADKVNNNSRGTIRSGPDFLQLLLPHTFVVNALTIKSIVFVDLKRFFTLF